MPNPPSNFRDVHPSNFRNVHSFLQIFFKVVTVPLRNSALHCVVRTFIHIDVDLPHAPTAAQKESLPEIEFCKSSLSRSENLTLRFRVVRPGSIPEVQLNLMNSDCEQSRLSRKRDGHRTRVGWALTIRRRRCPLHPRGAPLSRSVSLHSATKRSRHPASNTAAIDP